MHSNRSLANLPPFLIHKSLQLKRINIISIIINNNDSLLIQVACINTKTIGLGLTASLWQQVGWTWHPTCSTQAGRTRSYLKHKPSSSHSIFPRKPPWAHHHHCQHGHQINLSYFQIGQFLFHCIQHPIRGPHCIFSSKLPIRHR